MALSDINADGDNKLIIADLGTGSYAMKLKVFKGSPYYLIKKYSSFMYVWLIYPGADPGFGKGEGRANIEKLMLFDCVT